MYNDNEEIIEEKKEFLFGFSGIHIPAEVDCHPYLKDKDKRLFGYIKNLSQTSKGCWASNYTLGSYVGLTQTSTSAAIRRLKEHKFITIDYDEQTKSGFKIRRIFINAEYHKYYLKLARAINDNLVLDGSLAARKQYKEIVDSVNKSNKNEGLINSNKDTSIINSNKSPLLELINKKEYSNKGNIKLFSKENNNCFFSKNKKNNSFILKRRKKSYPISLNPIIPKSIENIISYWNASGLQQHKNPNTKLYRKIIISITRLKKGTFFNSLPINGDYSQYKTKIWTQEEIQQGISNFVLAATNCDYEPKSEKSKEWLRKQSLAGFLWNEYAPDDKSLLLKYFDTKPELTKQGMRPLKDNHPKMTKLLQQIYNEKTSNNLAPRNIPVNINNCFVKAAKLENEFIKKLIRQRLIDSVYIRTNRNRAEMLIDASLSNLKSPKDLRPHYLCSDYFFDDIYPRYLNDQAILEGTIH